MNVRKVFVNFMLQNYGPKTKQGVQICPNHRMFLSNVIFFCPIRCFWGAKVGGMGCVFFAMMLQNRNSQEPCLTLFSSVDACRTRRMGINMWGIYATVPANPMDLRGLSPYVKQLSVMPY